MKNNSIFKRNGKPQNVLVLKGFVLSFAFLAIYMCVYIAFGMFMHETGSNTGGFFEIWGPPFLIAFFASLFCCLSFLILKQKEQIPVAFTFLLILYLVAIIYVNAAEAEQYRAVEVALINLYCLPCVICGNLIGWGLFFSLNKKYKSKAFCFPAGRQPSDPARN